MISALTKLREPIFGLCADQSSIQNISMVKSAEIFAMSLFITKHNFRIPKHAFLKSSVSTCLQAP